MRSMIVMELSCIVSTFIVILRSFSDSSSASSVPLFSVLLYFTFPLLMPAPVLLSGSQSSTFLIYVSQNTQSCLPGPSTYVRSTPFSVEKIAEIAVCGDEAVLRAAAQVHFRYGSALLLQLQKQRLRVFVAALHLVILTENCLVVVAAECENRCGVVRILPRIVHERGGKIDDAPKFSAYFRPLRIAP